jgi:hypothetical protein
MVAHIQGVIRGKQIELERETGLPTSSIVMVRIEPKRLPLEEKRRLAKSLCGVWTSDTSLESIFAEIERLRAVNMPREVNFHAAS